MPRREHLDLRNGIILTFLAIIVVLYSKLLHQNLTITSNTPHEVTLPNNQDAKSTIEVSTTTNHPLSAYETEITHYDGLIKYTRTSLDNAKPNLLILLLTKDDTSWGHDVDAPPRTFHDFLTLLEDTKLDLSSTSLALWTSSPEQYALFRTATTSLPLARLSVFLDPSTDTSDRGTRHDPDITIQTARRARVARLRNKLLIHALGVEPHLLWLDADVQFLSPGIVQLILAHSATNPKAGIITARCQDGPTYNYDKNAWAGVRAAEGGTVSADPEIAREEGEKVRLVDELIEGTRDGELVRLDAVGGTILYMRAGLVWEGLNFPSYNVVGTSWGRDGGDGIETEGVCYAARGLEGGGCYVLGGKNYVRHTNL